MNDARTGAARRPGGAEAVCLATATTEPFLPGTLVTLHSFAQCHPDFAGDVVVIHDELSATAQHLLRAICPRVRLVPVSSALRQRVRAFGDARPAFSGSLPRFFVLDVFRLSGYRKVLYCDSDLLFRQPVAHLFSRSEALLCCGDKAQLLGRHRNAASFAQIDPTDRPGTLRQPFNTGFLLIDGDLLTAERHAALLAMLVPEKWPADTFYTDQLVLNRYFAGTQTLTSSTYNFLLGSAPQIQRREGIAAADAKVVHFNVPVKPWMPAEALAQTPAVARRAWSFWYEAWLACLSILHLRTSTFRKP